MAKPVQRGRRQVSKQVVKSRREAVLPLARENYWIVVVGIAVILLGFVALAQDGVEGTMPLVVAPILLFLGYLVIVPIGLMYRKKTKQEDSRQTAETAHH